MRAGSVPVAELIKKRRVPIKVSAYDKPLALGIVKPQEADEEERPHTHRLQPVKAGSFVRAAGLGVATVVFCASFGAAALIDQRRQEPLPLAIQPMVEMSGDRSLLPALFNIGPTHAPEAASPSGPQLTRTPTVSTTVDQDISTKQDDHAPTSESTTAQNSTAAEGTAQAESKAETVRKFYDLVRQQPAQAAELFAHALQTNALSQFITSWTSVGRIDLVDVRERADGMVATINMVLPGEYTMRVQQLLRFTDEQPPKIHDARVISAQRS
jgi:predicted  nucleic acid-binding Zn-ribbon protein